MKYRLRRLRLFLRIVWRRWETDRIGVRLAWEVAGCVHHKPWSHPATEGT